MRPTTLLATSLLAGYDIATFTDAASVPGYNHYTKGFKNPTLQSSVGGKAICFSGTIDVVASAENVHVELDQPKNQTDLTNLILEFTEINSTLASRIQGSSQDVSGTYRIYSQLCIPNTLASTPNASTVQFLVHGGGFDRQYWNNAPDYSYVDFAAERGYITFFYDRLGTGLSEHPDPLQVVQLTLHVAIAHELTQLLRSGGIGSQAFKHIVGVGHSYGSFQLLGLTSLYPEDLDAVVLTGAAAEPSGMTFNTVGQVQTIASQDDPLRFSNLPTGYALPGFIEGLQYGFFRAPFDPQMLRLAESTKQPQGLGEILVFGDIKPSQNFSGPLYVLNGENDLPVCLGNCLLPYNKAAAVKDVLFPAASNGSGWYLVPGSGHGVNYNYGARDAYSHIQDFVKQNGF